MNYYQGRAAVVTGAGSGIGQELAVQLAGLGARVAAVDVDGAAAEQTARLCGKAAVAEAADITDYAALAALAPALAAALGGVDLLFCAAGVIHSGSLLDSDVTDFQRVISVNLGGTVNTVKAFLPHLAESGAGQVVTFSSAFGLAAVPRYSAYCASKFGIRGLSEALRLELALEGCPVTVTCVYPGAVRTPIVRSGTFAPSLNRAAVAAGFDRLARTDPAAAAATVLRKVRQGRGHAYVGADARVVALAVRAAGGSLTGPLVRVLQRRARRAAR